MNWLAAAMTAAQGALDLATRNLAHLGDAGYRRLNFTARLTDGGIVTGTQKDATLPGVQQTGLPTDLAVVGGTLSMVGERAQGGGRYRATSAGHLVDAHGFCVRGQHGALRYPVGARIDAAGGVRVGDTLLDRIALAPGARLVVGAVPAAVGDPVREMVGLLQAQRGFETAQRAALAFDAIRAKEAGELARSAT